MEYAKKMDWKDSSLRMYLEAVNKVINEGKPVAQLDDIKTFCNESYMKSNAFTSLSEEEKADMKKPFPYCYNVEAIIFSVISDAENRILMGESHESVYRIYSTYDTSAKDFRQRGIALIKRVLEKNLT